MFKKTKRIISCVLIITLLASILPSYNRTAEAAQADTNEPFPYVMFAGGDGESLKIQTQNLTVNGAIHTNGIFAADTQNANVNGKIYAASGSAITGRLSEDKIAEADVEDIILIKQKIKDTYFTDNSDIYDEALDLSEINLNISKSFYSGESIHAEGNINLNAAAGAAGGISLEGGSLNANNAVIYSETGDISFNFNNTNITGLVYAPNGKVTIDSEHVQVNGTVIAREIEVISSSVNLNYNSTIAGFVGSTSEAIGKYPEVVRLADGEIDGEYLYKAVYPNLMLAGLGTDNVLLSDDYDGDGLTLGEEYHYDTNPFSADTDGDGLDDYSEINLYHTNPRFKDTDRDGMSDGTEVSCGLDPLKEDSDSDGIPDSEETVIQEVNLEAVNEIDISETLVKPQVQITGRGDYSGRLYAEDISYHTAVSEAGGIVGHPFDFVHEEGMEFDSSRLSFTIGASALDDNALEELAIAYYNLDNNSIEILETEYDRDTDTIWAEVDHYSIYFVINLMEYLLSAQYKIHGSIIESGKADIVFIINTTFNMWEVMDNVKTNLNQFLDELEENHVDVRLKLIEYQTIWPDGEEAEKTYDDWYLDTDSFREVVASLDTIKDGGSHMGYGDALEYAQSMDFRGDTSRHIIRITDHELLLTSADEETYYSYKKDSITSLSVETEDSSSGKEVAGSFMDGIIYSSISPEIGTDPRVIASNGVDAFIYDNFAQELSSLLGGMKYSAGSGCWVRLTNGNIVQLDKDPSLGDRTVDTDEDGIPDLDELDGVEKQYYYDMSGWKLAEYEAWSFHSDPSKADTDGDGLKDPDDIAPCSFDVRVILEDEYSIGFNTYRVWHKINYNAFDYLENLEWWAASSSGNVFFRPQNMLTVSEMYDIQLRYEINLTKSFNISELAYIGVMNNEGSKLYLNEKSDITRERIFKILFLRESRYYQHDGSSGDNPKYWKEVQSYEEGGFFKGKVISEYDWMFSTKLYYLRDIYDVLEELTIQLQQLCLLIVGVAAVEYTVASLTVLAYYVSSYGIVNGVQYCYWLGASGYNNGIVTFLQQDMADGDSSADDLLVLNERYMLAVEKGIYIIPYGLSKEEYLQCLNYLYLYNELLSKAKAGAIEIFLKNIKAYNIVVKSADEVNDWWRNVKGYTEPPYAPGKTVLEFELAETTKFVRVYDGVNSEMRGQWFMKAEDIAGLTPKQIQNKFALPTEPKYIVDLELPAGANIRCGEANSLFGYSGRGVQFDMKGQYIGEWVNSRLLQ